MSFSFHSHEPNLIECQIIEALACDRKLLISSAKPREKIICLPVDDSATNDCHVQRRHLQCPNIEMDSGED